MDQNKIEPILYNTQTRWLTLQDDFAQAFSETRQGKSLWKIFLAIAMVLLLAETIIGRPEPLKMRSEDL